MSWKPLDFLMLFLCLAVFSGSLIWLLQPKGGQPMAYIKSSQGEWYYPLDQDQNLEMEGPLGTTHIHIEDGQASIIDSPCQNKTCLRRNHLDSSGDWTACLPNQIFLTIEGESQEGDLDDQTF